MLIICFQIENCIDEWLEGIHVNIPFSQDTYKSVYYEHLEELNNFDKHTKELKMLPALLSKLYDEGRWVFKFSLYSNKHLTVSNTYSLHSKADSIEKPQRAQSPSAYIAAMEEFRNGGYDNSGDVLEEIWDYLACSLWIDYIENKN
jgi:hypothetical protein